MERKSGKITKNGAKSLFQNSDFLPKSSGTNSNANENFFKQAGISISDDISQKESVKMPEEEKKNTSELKSSQTSSQGSGKRQV